MRLRLSLVPILCTVIVPTGCINMSVNEHIAVSGGVLESPQRPVATYSIVARDPRTGEMGVAVQSHWFSVGAIVPWAESGVGAVATQSFVDPAYGRLGLDLMRIGKSAPQSLQSILAGDEGREVRQVAMIDAHGAVAAHTGVKCIAEAGHLVDPGLQFSVQANMMDQATVWDAMAQAYRESQGDLADRLLAALQAAQDEGGDIRGRQSAAILIVKAHPSGKSWLDRTFDLRVEDHPEPVQELKRLVRIQRAYLHMNAGDLALERGDMDGALAEYAAAQEYAPQIVEITFWHAITLVGADRLEEAIPLFQGVFQKEPKWRDLLSRLVTPGIIKDEMTVRAILDRSR